MTKKERKKEWLLGFFFFLRRAVQISPAHLIGGCLAAPKASCSAVALATVSAAPDSCVMELSER